MTGKPKNQRQRPVYFQQYLLQSSLILCNDLFSRFEQQTSILEKLAEATDPTTDRHGHDGLSQGLVSKHLENLKLGTENRLSELRDGMAGRTVTGVTDRHGDFSENPFSELCDDLQDGPSQARRPVTGCANPRQSRISGEVLRDVFGLFFP